MVGTFLIFLSLRSSDRMRARVIGNAYLWYLTHSSHSVENRARSKKKEESTLGTFFEKLCYLYECYWLVGDRFWNGRESLLIDLFCNEFLTLTSILCHFLSISLAVLVECNEKRNQLHLSLNCSTCLSQ